MMATPVTDAATPTIGDRPTVLARFAAAPTVTTEQYDESIRRFQALGGGWPPDGLAYHVAFGSEGNLRVNEIWDSREQFDAWGKHVMLTDIEVEFSSKPEMLEIHNIIQR
jgi:hypothetical protein